ncbi:MAG: acyltransferase [Promethearchaeota archaeon]|jgi:acetyltransferase-like isoleucine patch superfamily enzyme
MFQPASLKGESPVPIDERIRNKFLVIYILIIILSFIPSSLFEYWYFTFLWSESFIWGFFLLLPFNALVVLYLIQFSAILSSVLILKVVNLIHAPKEGNFKRSLEDRNYVFWNIRNIIKKWPLYVMASNPFPWFKNRFTLRFFGVKIGRKTMCDNSWISSEFVSIGKNVIIGMNSSVLSFGIEQDNFILKKVRVESNVIIGAKCVLLPGTLIEGNVKLSAHSYTNHNAILEENSIYKGHPAKIISVN